MMFGWFFVTRGCHQSRGIRVTKVEGFGPSSFQHHHSCPDPMEEALAFQIALLSHLHIWDNDIYNTEIGVIKKFTCITPNSLQYKNASSDPINLQFLLQKSLH